MSGILKKIGKVFKQIIKSPIFKAVAIAAAIYFTAGIAAGAMGSAFAASLPGISSAAGAIGLGGVGAIPAVGAAALGSVGVATAGAVAGDAMLPAALAGTNGLAGTVGLGVAGDALLPAALAGTNGLGGTPGLGAMAADATASSGIGVGDVIGAVNKAQQGASVVQKALGSTDETSGDSSSSIDSSGKTVKAPTLQNGSGKSGGVDGVLKFFNDNPVVGKAVMTFGSDALKSGVAMYAQKSQQDVADERAAQTRGRIAAPILQNPATYNKGIVNAVAGTGS